MGENFEWNLSESKIDDIAYETIISIILLTIYLDPY